jgi:hypothetical protein
VGGWAPAGFGWRPLLRQLFLTHGQVEPQIVIQVAVKLPATEQRLNSQPNPNYSFGEHDSL